MNANYVRIKINICINSKIINKFWYFLNNNLLLTIEQFENDLRRTLIEKFNYLNFNDKKLNLYIEDFMLPNWEKSSIIRDNDLIE
jgi:hypothetical protein